MTDTPTLPNRLWEIFEYNGRLAIYAGDLIGPADPVRTVYLRVSNVDAGYGYGITGQRPWSNGRAWPIGVVNNARTGAQVYVDGETWPLQELRIPIPKPRDGKEYTWRWASGIREWQRDSFPRCDVCGKYHNPIMTHCTWCEAAISKPKPDAIFCPACIAAGNDKIGA